MTAPLAPFIKQIFDAVEAKNITLCLSYFTDSAEFIDPHYPNNHMRGKAEITEGLTWGFKGIKKLGFNVTHIFSSEDGLSAAVEIATAHELLNGDKLNFPQVFIFEVKNEKITRLQAYEPYGPHGVFGCVLWVMRLVRRFTAFFNLK